MDNPQTLKHVSLCAGYGGIDLGLARALGDVQTITFVEIEAFAVVNLVKKIEAGHLDECPIFTDLKALPWEFYRGRVDILSGGFPCQPFSAAGRRAGDSDPRHLWPYIADGIRRMGYPPLIFLENVEGIISSKLKGSEWADPEGTPVLLHVLRELERLGYQATAGVFSASEVGAPHQRKRVFILGCRSDLCSEGREIVDRLLRATEHKQELAYSEHKRRLRPQFAPRYRAQLSAIGSSYPAPRGAEQYPWEPPRVTMGNTSGERLERSTGPSVQGRDPRSTRASMGNTIHRDEGSPRGEPRTLSAQRGDREADLRTWSSDFRRSSLQGKTEPKMGGDAAGTPCGLGYAELCESMDNRTDELRLLGNGVVPATAERAFRVLWKDLRSR